jgi:ribosomal protein L40E
MSVCSRCGEGNPAEAEFCGACGTFLAWREDSAEEQPKVLAPTPSVAQPAVQQPTDLRAPRRPPPMLTEHLPPSPGDLICGECGVGNAPTRRFCRHCGHSLAEAVAAKRRWWQRLIPRLRKRKRRVGARPKARGGRPLRSVTRFLGRMLLALLALAAVLYAAVPPFRAGVNHQAQAAKHWVQGVFVPQYTPVRPTDVTATTAMPDHEAALAADNAKNTYWAAPVPGAEPTLVFRFDHPVDLRRAIVHSGNKADFASTHRPAKVHLVYSTKRTFDVDLADTPDPQTVDLGESAGATSVEVHVVALHRAKQSDSVALSEIELFEKES